METYVVGFKIFDAKSLQTEDGGPCAPFVVVECCGLSYQTPTLEDRQLIAPFNRNCTWPNLELHPKQFESAYIEFKVFARNWFTRNFLIGKASLQLSFINKRPNCLYARKWLCLRRDGDPATTGMLNVTVFALKPGQQAPSATLQEQEQVEAADEEEGGDKGEEDRLSKAVLNAQVEAPPGKRHHVEINIHRVQDLPKVGGWTPSPYVTVEFAGVVLSCQATENVTECSIDQKFRIPVVTPLYEDTIILKLWSAFVIKPHELMAQGLISFSELRNNPLKSRWFNLYGWDNTETPDLHEITGSGVEPEPNIFKGRILVSGCVIALDDDAELLSAKVEPARNTVEPMVMQLALMADVYMVIGADGEKCMVEVSFGAISNKTQVVKSTQDQKGLSIDHEGEDMQLEQDVNQFIFREAQGRINPMLLMTPEEPESQPYVMINVYTENWMSGMKRVGFCRCKLEEFPKYEAGNPSKPKFFPLTPMPGAPPTSASSSILIAVETHTTDDIVRHARKTVKPMQYIVRAYCFMARKVEGGQPTDHYSLKVACAGRARITSNQRGPRPKWMKSLELNVTLYSDSAKEPPVIEPITLTLQKNGSQELGKAVCMYTHMRQKDNLGGWEPYVLSPQWIKVSGGRYGSMSVGEVLIAFELLLAKSRGELDPRDMWPQRPGQFDKKKHFCRLRKATLHFSLHGLRDLRPVPLLENLGSALKGGMVDVTQPLVEVQVAWGDGDEDGATPVPVEPGQPEEKTKMQFDYKKVVEGGDLRVKSDRLNMWHSALGGGVKGANFEFLQADKMKVLIPDQMILQPYVVIRVYEKPYRVKTATTSLPFGIGDSVTKFVGYDNYLVGESRRSLAEKLPCCWLEGIDMKQHVDLQEHTVREAFKKAQENVRVRSVFQQATEEELKKLKREHADNDDGRGNSALQEKLKQQMDNAKEYVNSTALPEPLRTVPRRRINIRPLKLANVQTEKSFSPRHGEPPQAGASAVVRTVQGKLEKDADPTVFKNDFWYKNAPLLKSADIVEDSDPREWDFLPDTCGYVKCTFKLVDGWEDDHLALTSNAQATAGDASRLADQARERTLRQSFGFDDELDKYAFDEKEFRRRFKNPEYVPSRVRVRMYLVKAVCIYGKAQDFPDPYVEYQMGRDHHVSLRSAFKAGTNQPDFYRFEERDIVLPDDSRLEIRVMDKGEWESNDTLIGSTIIDLEDRWHSTTWRKMSNQQTVPHENRPLCTPEIPGKNRGSIEMWIEMLETQHAADLKASPLIPPPQIELEVRLVIWDCKGVKLVKEDYVNVHITTYLDCEEYFGDFPKLQPTDTHFQSKDGNAIFNWRIVYPRIKMPVKQCSLKMDLLHYELLGNTPIGSLNLDLKKYVERVATNMDMVEIGPDYLRFSSGDAEDGQEPEEIGQAKVSLYVLTQSEASSKRAGIAREDPNDNPPLITPAEGRDWGTYLAGFGFSLPDFGMWKKLIPLFVLLIVFLVAVIGLKQMGLL